MFVIPMWTQRIWKGSEMRVLSCVNIEFLHVVAFFLHIWNLRIIFWYAKVRARHTIHRFSPYLTPSLISCREGFFHGCEKRKPHLTEGLSDTEQKKYPGVGHLWRVIRLTIKQTINKNIDARNFPGYFFYKKDKITESKIWSFLLIVIALYHYS